MHYRTAAIDTFIYEPRRTAAWVKVTSSSTDCLNALIGASCTWSICNPKQDEIDSYLAADLLPQRKPEGAVNCPTLPNTLQLLRLLNVASTVQQLLSLVSPENHCSVQPPTTTAVCCWNVLKSCYFWNTIHLLLMAWNASAVVLPKLLVYCVTAM